MSATPEQAKWKARKRWPCLVCGGPTGWAHTDPRGQGAACNPCRRKTNPNYRVPNQRARGMLNIWACAACGVSCSRPATKGQRPKWCQTCRKIKVSSGRWIPAVTRRAIYDRDNWTCWLCETPVDPTLIGSTSDQRPSLDHVVPRVHGGSDDPANLKLAHWWCNTMRCDGRAYSPEDFRVAV